MPTVPGHTRCARTPEHCACPARGTYHLPYRAAQSREQSSGVIEHVQSVSWCPFHQGPPLGLLWVVNFLRILGGTGENPFWFFYGPRDLSQIAASPPLLQPDSRRMAVTITNDQTDEHLLQRFSRAPS
jgi:hypothetical protein